MAERKRDFVTVNGLGIHKDIYRAANQLAESKGVTRTRVINNGVATEVVLMDAIDHGMRVVVLEPGAIIFAGRIIGKVAGEIDQRNYETPSQ